MGDNLGLLPSSGEQAHGKGGGLPWQMPSSWEELGLISRLPSSWEGWGLT